MDDPRERLAQIKEHHNDYTWLTDNLEYVYKEVKCSIHQTQFVQAGVDTLLKIYDFLLTNPDLERWKWILSNAMLEMLKLHDNERLVPIWEKVGQTNHLLGKPNMAMGAFENAVEGAQQQNRLQEMLCAYIGLFKAQMFAQDRKFSITQVNAAIELVKKVGTPTQQAVLYQMVAAAYHQRGETQATLGYGQMAYAAWQSLDNEPGKQNEMARIAFTLASACRYAGLLKQARRYLEQAKQLYMNSHDPRQYGLIAFEESEIAREEGDYVTAESWSMMALQEFQQLQSSYHKTHLLAMTYHSLALSQTKLDKQQLAKKSIKTALTQWLEIGNPFQIASAYNVLGYVEVQIGNHKRAREYFQRGLEICADLPDMQKRHMLESIMKKSLTDLVLEHDEATAYVK